MKEYNIKKQAIEEQIKVQEDYFMNKMKRCSDCDKPIKYPKQNRSGLCSACSLVKAAIKKQVAKRKTQ